MDRCCTNEIEQLKLDVTPVRSKVQVVINFLQLAIPGKQMFLCAQLIRRAKSGVLIICSVSKI